MNVLFIDEDFDVRLLSKELKKLYDIYIANREKSSDFNKIKHLKVKRPNTYIERCKELCKKVTYISFRADRMRFNVRPTFDGKRTFLGEFDSFDQALICLKEYFDAKRKQDGSDS